MVSNPILVASVTLCGPHLHLLVHCVVDVLLGVEQVVQLLLVEVLGLKRSLECHHDGFQGTHRAYSAMGEGCHSKVLPLHQDLVTRCRAASGQ
jgi:hypothetical protein